MCDGDGDGDDDDDEDNDYQNQCEFKACSRRFHSILQTYVFYLSISKAWFSLFKPLS